MNTEKFRAMLNLVESNPEVKEALNKATSLDEALAVLKSNGLEITPEEFYEFLKAGESDELPEEMLEFVAGGGKGWDWWQGFKNGIYDGTKTFADALVKLATW